ncbi:unnamed protein product [Phytophthora fragariaefolia]|uniref:Unnamed protein product n=1 Tax=Phytophthora fragariaefolia TaxID=1490495 RepID=A0A9W6Y820_9STRA|nr:unnamed protein product [Phytophthora fragariaefolia]
MPDASSSERGSPSSVSHVPCAQAAASFPKKKRVQRQQLELKSLRELSVQLEHHLTQLKRCQTGSTQQRPQRPSKGDADGSSLSGRVQHGPATVWEAIAGRQLKERSRAEKQNQELRLQLKAQSSAALSLQAKVHKAMGDKVDAWMGFRFFRHPG